MITGISFRNIRLTNSESADVRTTPCTLHVEDAEYLGSTQNYALHRYHLQPRLGKSYSWGGLYTQNTPTTSIELDTNTQEHSNDILATCSFASHPDTIRERLYMTTDALVQRLTWCLRPKTTPLKFGPMRVSTNSSVTFSIFSKRPSPALMKEACRPPYVSTALSAMRLLSSSYGKRCHLHMQEID